MAHLPAVPQPQKAGAGNRTQPHIHLSGGHSGGCIDMRRDHYQQKLGPVPERTGKL
jgi:glutaredoxin